MSPAADTKLRVDAGDAGGAGAGAGSGMASGTGAGVSARPAPTTNLTTFPNPFQDEVEPGLLPSLLSKVKSTFTGGGGGSGGGAPVPTPRDASAGSAAASGSSGKDAATGPAQKTEAQAIAEAARKQQAAAAAAAQAQASQAADTASTGGASGHASTLSTKSAAKSGSKVSGGGSAIGGGSAPAPTISARRGGSQLSIAPSGDGSPAPLLSPTTAAMPPPSFSAQSLPVPQSRAGHSHQSSGASASGLSSATPSIMSGSSQNVSRRHLVPGERNWRPSAATAQVTLSPVTSVTTTAPRDGDIATTTGESAMPPPRLMNITPTVEVTSARGKPVSGAAALGGGRLRRGSISTIPDSPSSVSLSAMISGNAELSQNNSNGYSFVPGFQLPAEDTRSVRSLGLTKRPHSVSKIIRRMRGEGLSKHYWMADENCKECYDCKSVFTTWRRKHHCRICGQIFCGRCASNIIGARRFGQDGMVRVCNLCLKIMEDYDDDDDRRSIMSTMSGLPDRVISPEMAYTASPYAASQLFRSGGGPAGTNDNLSAIEEMRGAYSPDDSDASDSEEGHHGNGLWALQPSTAAPFRRHDDDNSEENPHGADSAAHSKLIDLQTPSPGPGSSGAGLDSLPRRLVEFPLDARTRPGFPRTDTIESEDGGSNPSNPAAGLRTRMSSATSLRGLNNGLNALLDTDRKDGLWRARSHSFITPAEFLTGPSLAHFNTMLQQSIERHDLPNPATWHRVLSKLLLRVSTNLRPLVRAGDSIDIRTYVKIKKVPGGKITDSEYVDGIVITKNVAHKGMARRLVNPRIMVITFPLDYHRVETQFMSLDPIMKQERDYLRLLTKRIIDLRPHIVLVERFVSRVALDFLYAANIVVARGVKFSAIHQVARCTHADIIGSMDKLALEPRLGRCADFRVQTFEHQLIPGKRKTYMRFEGTHNGFGGTIILRGGDRATLGKVKLIADFLALVAYHLKNEAFLYGDEFQMLPPRPPLPEVYQELLRMLSEKRAKPPKVYGADVVTDEAADGASVDTPRVELKTPDANATPRADLVVDDKVEEEREAQRELSLEIAKSLEPYLTTVLSASVAVRFPPPYPLAKMAALDRKLNKLRDKRAEHEAAKILEEEKRPEQPKIEPLRIVIESEDDLAQKERDEAKEKEHKSLPSTAKDAADDTASVKSMPVVGTASESAPGASEVSATAPTSPHTSTPVPQPPTPATSQTAPPGAAVPAPAAGSVSQVLACGAKGDPYRILLNPDDFVEASTIAFVEHDHSEQLKLWQHYVRRNPGPLHPKNFQGIIYLQSLYRHSQDKPCAEPARQEINFYQEDDQTLGQFLGSMVANAGHRCPNKSCEQLMLFHYDVLVHAERRLQIAMEQFSCPLPGHEEQILTWSYCRQCNRSWEPTVIREETWRMSWGAYLEHCFYPPETRTGFGCSHDAYREHIRYFAHHNMVIRIHNDEIELFEPVRPSIKLMARVEDKVALKNQEYESALAKTSAFFDSVLHRLRSFTDDLVEPEKQPRMHADRDALLTRAVADRDEMVNALNRTYKQTPPTDVLALNVVLQALQDKVIQWDLDFLDVEKLYMPTAEGLRRMTATHLKRLFATHDVFGSLDKNVTSVPEVDEGEKSGALTDTGDSQPSTKPASPELGPSLDPKPLETTAKITPGPAVDSPVPLEIGDPTTTLAPASSPPSSEATTPAATEHNEGAGSTASESVTPTPTLSRGSNLRALSLADTPMPDTGKSYESDSTVSAMPIPCHEPKTPGDLAASSGMDSDAFASRFPRRQHQHQSPSVADLVRRFQDKKQPQSGEDGVSPMSPPPKSPAIERPRSAGGHGRRTRHEPIVDISDSDAGRPVRPFLRRSRHSEHVVHRSTSRPNLLSDGDRSYAVNASRVVSHKKHSDPTAGPSSTATASTAASRGRLSRPVSPSRGRFSRTASPSNKNRSKDGRLTAPGMGKSISLEGKPRLGGKGKTPRKPSGPGAVGVASPGSGSGGGGGGLVRGLPRRVIGAGTRVTSIARHFDKISREAERDRQKRISLARGKRAGRVGVTKAKVQVFNNVRDAFKDEFDSDSSAADNEADDLSDVSVDSTGRAKPRRRPCMSPTDTTRPNLLPPIQDVPLSPPPKRAPKSEGGDDEDKQGEAAVEGGEAAPAVPEGTTTPGTSPTRDKSEATDADGTESIADSVDTGAGSKINKDRLHIELAPFDTNAPLPSVPPTPAPQMTEDESKGLSQLSQMSESEMSSGGVERGSILKALTGLRAIRTGDFTPLEYPLSAAEHIFVDSRVIVRENEPTSIIAFTLSSKQYRDQIRSVAAAAKTAAARRHEPSLLDEVTSGDRQWDIISVDDALEPDDVARREAGTHLKYEFEAGSSTISCRIFFAEQFASLRQACQCEDGFIESLARCAKFDASGGKSGSAFLKTKDDRFIVKEISRYEMDAITKFAPAYFEYTSTAFQRARPTALAKTYGIFKIGFRNGVTGRSMHMNVLVQENLFYGRHFSKIYDLKGSTRNRLIKPTGKVNEVLLDENLMEISHTSPLYLRDHSKRILRTALWNDTLFLSNLNVMDYSLVVGVDAERKELVVGVVDYIRTFTWDKKVESWVKDFGGGGRGEPTIVTPLQYRKRFRTAMERVYFPSVPDRWSVAGADRDEAPKDDEGGALINM